MRIVCVAGARPNFVKIAPVLPALEAHGHDVVLVHTGQHYGAAMSEVFFDELGLRSPDHHLGAGSGSHARQTAAVMVAFEELLAGAPADAVVVVGDVNSTVACALVAAKAGCLVAHVEAGLRSRDWSMPEEVNRVVTDRVSHLLLAPSPDAVANLHAEGYRADQVHLVGNVMIDTLFAHLGRARRRRPLDGLGVDDRYGVLTLHRPSNVDDEATFVELLAALGSVSAELPLVFPVHPRTRHALEGRPVPDGVVLVDPMGYLDFVALMDGATVVVTDSGGVQEETTALGRPCVTVRDNTERPITVDGGTNLLAGTDPSAVAAAVAGVVRHPPAPRCPSSWDGHAAERVAEVITSAGGQHHRPGPTDLR